MPSSKREWNNDKELTPRRDTGLCWQEEERELRNAEQYLGLTRRFEGQGFGLSVLWTCASIGWIGYRQKLRISKTIIYITIISMNLQTLTWWNITSVSFSRYKYFAFFQVCSRCIFLPVWKWYCYEPNIYLELKINEWIRPERNLPKTLILR